MVKRKHYSADMSAPLRCVVIQEVIVHDIYQLTRRAHRRVRDLKITMADVARRMGISPGRLSQIITSERMGERNFAQLSEALEMKPEDWLSDLPRPLGVEDGYALIRERVRKKLARLRGISPKQGKKK